MKLHVIKYGGTSVASVDRFHQIAKYVCSLVKSGDKVVVVVSAMGKTTDQLVDLARSAGGKEKQREYGLLLSTGEVVSCSLLAMALQSIGCNAIALTGPQVGIETDMAYDEARIESIDTKSLTKYLDDGTVPVVAGFQGHNCDEITLLGRGGSDTTAVAIAAALKADDCTIFTDVNGIYTADPRIVYDAVKLDMISYEEMIELSSCGAQVMMGRSIEIAQNYEQKITVRSSFADEPGTLITDGGTMEKAAVTSISLEKEIALFHVSGLDAGNRQSSGILELFRFEKVTARLISLHRGQNGHASFSFVVSQNDTDTVCEILNKERVNNKSVEYDYESDLAIISVVGSGMGESRNVTPSVFSTLSETGVDVLHSSSSEIRLAVVVPFERANDAIVNIHKELGMHNIQRKYLDAKYA